MSIFLFQTCSSLKKEKDGRAYDNKLNTQNRLASLDSIHKDYNKKIKSWEFTKAAYVLELENLKNYDQGLYDTIKKLKGKVAVLIASQGKIDLGGLVVDNNLITYPEPNHYGLKSISKYEDPGLKQTLILTSKFYVIPNVNTLKYTIKPDSTFIDTNLLNIKIIYGMKELDNKFQVFAISASPKVELTDLTGGYFIDKQPPPPPITKMKKWGIGPYVGVGLNMDINGSNIRAGWSVGISLHYDLLQWRMPWEK